MSLILKKMYFCIKWFFSYGIRNMSISFSFILRSSRKDTLSNSNVMNEENIAAPQIADERSLKKRAVAKLKLFNLNLNWDLHMSHCKPCR